MAKGKPIFGLEKTWRASGTGTTTFNAPGNYTIPYGRYDITVEGRGGTGTAASPGNYVPGNANPPNAGNYVPGNANPPNPASPNPPNAGNYVPGNPTPATPGNPTPPNPGSYTPGNPTPPNPGSYTPGNPAVPGSPSTALGVTLPGSNVGGTTAPFTPAAKVNYYAVPDFATYPVSVASGGYVTVKNN